MILVDTSVWIDHFRAPDEGLAGLIRRRAAIMHPFVLGELIMGHLRAWRRTVDALQALPRSTVVSEDELVGFVTEHQLQGTGLGFVDAHLLAVLRNAPATTLWTRDRRLAERAATMSLPLYTLNAGQ